MKRRVMNQIFNLQSPWSSQGQMERFLNIMLSVGSSAAQLTSTYNSLCVAAPFTAITDAILLNSILFI